MRSFHRNRSLETILHFLKVFATLLLFYHSSFFPILLQSFSHIYDLSITVFSNSFFAFLILNAIILFLYILSNQNGDVSDEDTYNHNHNENENQFLQITASELVTDPVESLPEKQQDQVVEMASPENQRDLCPVFKETVTAVTETMTTTMTCCTTVTTSGDDDDKVSISEKKCYRRVQSEFYERRELKKELCYVENMSKEEFNRTVEEFIAKHKRMQREEHEQLRSQKTEYLALVP
ncbi:uncharacterized protein LOC131657470 [Vicia villosa]|uniref:uncharacterized protein LOC131657470 n=1 Tax=Vicia villosa TaxID=3911 RepID=UPI00273B2A72|nr:uncharacterized protein LOC131657470 [Vicia villosa]